MTESRSRTRSSVTNIGVVSTPDDNTVAVAVLYERLGHVIARLDEMNDKLDRRFSTAEAQTAELERRVEKIENDLNRARGFLFGLAAAGGFVGGGVATAMAKVLGG
jgi:molybdopterin-biosynthesis enzyme MoeA-like protein